MIEEISIRDLGVIESATLPLGAGFTALTGETGAGKTMVVTALGLLLGQRADSAVVRSGAGQLWVEGRWQVPVDGEVAERVRDAGGDLDDAGEASIGELVLSRSVAAEGRSRAVVGGRGAPVSVLAELAEQLVVVHGQSDQIRLRSATAQREALDRFGGAGLDSVLAAYQSAYRRWNANSAELAELIDDRDRRAREADDLRVALSEIEAVAPEPGEDETLAEQAERLTNLETLRLGAAVAREALSTEDAEGPDVRGLLETARRELERAGAHDPALQELAEQVAGLGFQVDDAAAQLSTYLAALDADGAHDLEVIQERRAELSALVRKYGPTLDEVMEQAASGGKRLAELEGDEERIEQLTSTVRDDLAEVERCGASLSQLRSTAAASLAEQVTAELGALAMADAEIVVDVQQRDEFTLTGRDAVSILLRPHNGAEPRPLGKGASGGELSRVMLAIEVVLAGNDPVPTFVFDEIDAGVGGAAAIEIGRRLARLARSAQVIVVTHLAQVAAFATNHLTVVKAGDGSVTASSVRQLTGDERVAEMARLLSGLPDSESGLAHARELIELAEEKAAASR
ncbi:DNA repair protein RecN [Humibacter ginsenosidimutans]|uniref:DNA repair protein RecN n=1 Tax=Humibacter ginsenosidimutans TaxID=2599293 RepID=A0A5B8M0V1_9MICO|nr:DNA repair protein RecN [Humibacter ginsenosidimutans]QDZ13554.1 DNA repair protein RecN [Humibacter ginsenosidimutans]